MGSGGGQNERSAPRIPGAPLGLNNVIEKNYIIENGAGGIIGANNRNIIIRDNVIMYNNTLGFIGKKRYEHGGIKSHDIGGFDHKKLRSKQSFVRRHLVRQSIPKHQSN